MSEYTPGTMKPCVSEFLGQDVFTAVPDGNEEKIVAVFGFCGAEDEAESIANVRRFCDVWNACAGLDTDLLENILMTGETLKSRFELLKQEIGESK
jgi:hypothetical protein